MQRAIQFETVVESGIIRVPEEYANTISAAVKVTLAPLSNPPHIKVGVKSEAGILSSDDFNALKIDTKNWKFNREEANERR